jgi:hypothetical protein
MKIDPEKDKIFVSKAPNQKQAIASMVHQLLRDPSIRDRVIYKNLKDKVFFDHLCEKLTKAGVDPENTESEKYFEVFAWIYEIATRTAMCETVFMLLSGKIDIAGIQVTKEGL